MTTRIRVWAAALMVALAATACSGEPADTGLTDEQAKAEYDAIVQKYPLPGGEKYPTLEQRTPAGRVIYDRKYAAASLARAHAVCAYLRFWADSADKQGAAAKEALANLERLNNDPEAIPSPNELVAFTSTIIDQAKLGDPSKARGYIEVNC